MISPLKSKSEFNRNVLVLMTGTTVAQAIPVAISPILTRIYTPDDFGVLALFAAITLIFGAIANARYELAIMLPESDEDAFNIAALGLFIAACLSAALLVVAVVYNQGIADALGNGEIGFWLYFAPLAVFFIGLFNVLNYFNNRMKNYKDIARAHIYKSLVLATVQLGVGFIKSGAVGLISGQVLSYIFVNLKLLKNTLARVDARKTFSTKKMKALAIRYKDFPKYSMWAILANTLSQNLTNILVSSYYSVATLGFYALVQRVLGMPSLLVGEAVGQVFFQQATQEKQTTGRAVKTFDSTVKKLILIAVPSFGILFLVAEELFTFIFGGAWRVAGVYAMILTPLFAIRFITAAVSNINNIFEKQRIALSWQAVLLVLSVGIIAYSNYAGLSFESFLVLLSTALTTHYAVLYVIMLFVSRGKL